VPYGVGPRGDVNDECQRLVIVARFSPELQCVWEGPPEGDDHPDWRHVLSTPVVIDFNFDGDPFLVRPSVVFTSDDGGDGSSELSTGLIRIIDGRDCSQQYSLDMVWTSHSSPPAAGDLNGDGVPEIVAFRGGGGLIAFTYSADDDAWSILWTSHYPDGSNWQRTGGGWGGPAIHDLDDDGVPEVLRGGTVFDAFGALVDDSIGYLVHGTAPANMSAVMDVDGDGQVEIVSGDGVWGWDTEASTWVAEAYFSGSSSRGHIAVADLGDFPLETVDYDAAPEVIVVSGGLVRAQTIEGDVIFGPIAIPGGGSGGPPTVGDLDGDGRAEFAAAGRGSYTVFDLDCTDAEPVGTCGSGRTDGILWTRPSQDLSSSSTGSSIFDFEGDGRAEAIYADECFVRVYDGPTGNVIFSQYRSSCTWHENPIVADVDGDFNSELIVPSNLNCGPAGRACTENLEAGAIDALFVGIQCEENADCVSGLCDEGYCRCASENDCCPGGCGDSGFVCAAPPVGTAGTGNTCRASHPRGTAGIRIYRDALDRWVNSRPIWNQHGYFVTNVAPDGTIPSTSEALRNWEEEGLNNYRQNIQGGHDELDAPDLTGRGETRIGYCDPVSGHATLSAVVCNRGAEPVDLGVEVVFYEGAPEDGVIACSGSTAVVLAPGECDRVECVWETPATEEPGRDITVVVDPRNRDSECTEGNNTDVIEGAYCE
jgi:hypothetical protein